MRDPSQDVAFLGQPRPAFCTQEGGLTLAQILQLCRFFNERLNLVVDTEGLLCALKAFAV